MPSWSSVASRSTGGRSNCRPWGSGPGIRSEETASREADPRLRFAHRLRGAAARCRAPRQRERGRAGGRAVLRLRSRPCGGCARPWVRLTLIRGRKRIALWAESRGPDVVLRNTYSGPADPVRATVDVLLGRMLADF